MNKTPTAADADLKERILLSAIEEFGRLGYDAASTNVIVQHAGVSKGLLFHYYGNKEKLFLECINYTFSRIGDHFSEHFPFTDDDLFHRIRFSLSAKMDFYREHPMLMEFASKLWDSEQKPEFEKLIRRMTGVAPATQERLSIELLPDSTFYFLISEADRSKLNDGVSLDVVVDSVSILLSASWNRFAAKYGGDAFSLAGHLDEYLVEADVILDLIRRGAYRDAMSP